jgi:hypothetical protein
VAEESTDSASGGSDPEEIQQEDFQPALSRPATTRVQTEMAASDDDRQEGEDEDPDRYTVHAFPSVRIVAATSARLARSVIP